MKIRSEQPVKITIGAKPGECCDRNKGSHTSEGSEKPVKGFVRALTLIIAVSALSLVGAPFAYGQNNNCSSSGPEGDCSSGPTPEEIAAALAAEAAARGVTVDELSVAGRTCPKRCGRR
jgi:hypothetical protein